MLNVREVLIGRIEQEFGRACQPSAEELVKKNAIRDDETVEAENAFQEKHWRSVYLQDLMFTQAFSIFTPKSLAFYLPAYMLAIIKHYEECDILVDRLLHFLTPSCYENFLVLCHHLDDRQHNVIAFFLYYIMFEHPNDFPFGEIQTAFDKYWNKFLLAEDRRIITASQSNSH